MPITHLFQSADSDGPDTTLVRPSDWNKEHVIDITDLYDSNITPTGAVDGVNDEFTLPATPNPVGTLILSRNGIIQVSGIDFTITGPTITFLAGKIPQSGDSLRAWYWKIT